MGRYPKRKSNSNWDNLANYWRVACVPMVMTVTPSHAKSPEYWAAAKWAYANISCRAAASASVSVSAQKVLKCRKIEYRIIENIRIMCKVVIPRCLNTYILKLEISVYKVIKGWKQDAYLRVLSHKRIILKCTWSLYALMANSHFKGSYHNQL